MLGGKGKKRLVKKDSVRVLFLNYLFSLHSEHTQTNTTTRVRKDQVG